MPDNSFYYITRRDKERRLKNICHNLQLKYSFSETGRYVFQATLGTDLSNCPDDYTLRENIVNQECDTVGINSSDKSFSPVLDLYYNQNIGRNIATLLIHGAMKGNHLIAILLMVTAGRFLLKVYMKTECVC